MQKTRARGLSSFKTQAKKLLKQIGAQGSNRVSIDAQGYTFHAMVADGITSAQRPEAPEIVKQIQTVLEAPRDDTKCTEAMGVDGITSVRGATARSPVLCSTALQNWSGDPTFESRANFAKSRFELSLVDTHFLNMISMNPLRKSRSEWSVRGIWIPWRYLTLTHASYPKKLAFAFLDDVAQEFQLELQREFGGTAGVDFRSKVRAAVFQPKTTQG